MRRSQKLLETSIGDFEACNASSYYQKVMQLDSDLTRKKGITGNYDCSALYSSIHQHKTNSLSQVIIRV